jgi:hypothetical protein
MIELDIFESVDIDKVFPEEIILNFLEKEKKVLYVGESTKLDEEVGFSLYKKITEDNICQIEKIDEKFDYVILTEILEKIDDPQDLIKKVKTIAENIVIYEYKFDPGCYNNNEWKKPWLKIGLEYFLGKEFDYVNSIFLGYATIYFCKFPYDKTSDDYRIAENAIR